MKQSRTIAGTVKLAPLPPPVPSGIVPAFPVSVTHPDYPTYTNYVLKTAAGTNQFNYGIHHMALWWAADGRKNNAVRDWCVASFRKRLAAALAQWNLKQSISEFARDSYLYCGDSIASYVYALNWFGDQFTVQEIADAEMVVNQAVWNVWNYTLANWNGTKVAWSGWATGDPCNNYFIRSHWRGLIYWAIHSQRSEWLQKIQDLLPKIKSAYATLAGGGWLEGTGYGISMWNLCMDVWLMRKGLGIDLTADAHIAEHIDYWLWANTPGLKSFAPIGDAPVLSVSDSHRAILTWAGMLVPDSPQAAHARWWFAQSGLKASRPENLWMTCYDIPAGPTAAPTGGSYHAAGVGHLFAKSDDGAMLCMQAGPFKESHDHKDQGEFQLYLAGWKIVTANVPSSSDIIQSIGYHNSVMFRNAANVVIEPEWGDPTPPSMIVTDDGNLLGVTVDLKRAYDNAPDILAYARTLSWDRAAKRLKVFDSFDTKNGVTGVWRATFMDQPIANADGTWTAGALTVKPSQPPLPMVDWMVEKSTVFNQHAWRFEMTGANAYNVEISW